MCLNDGKNSLNASRILYKHTTDTMQTRDWEFQKDLSLGYNKSSGYKKVIMIDSTKRGGRENPADTILSSFQEHTSS